MTSKVDPMIGDFQKNFNPIPKLLKWVLLCGGLLETSGLIPAHSDITFGRSHLHDVCFHCSLAVSGAFDITLSLFTKLCVGLH